MLGKGSNIYRLNINTYLHTVTILGTNPPVLPLLAVRTGYPPAFSTFRIVQLDVCWRDKCAATLVVAVGFNGRFVFKHQFIITRNFIRTQ